ncbi:pyridoxal-phosphate dependent enzyme [Govanella unica]|uniref:Pyridoxal-phosphate dependent enzyme n=1 Tax=Govanella unica TaxID=2975056 RepID=A0A9X3TYT6_9PROT|nr:pyridoxal-phosphate dependent enzyme [Govania unica]MDA5194230.1 pyridoxal-phosphate dependent enzyme [Govania unica]
MMSDLVIPTLDDMRAAARTLAPHIAATPVHHWIGPELERRIAPGTQVFLKLELFQRTGTFKIRGALLNLIALDEEARRRGVTAVSAGNHAIAVACAAHSMGVSAKVVMMASANPARVAAARAFGAEVLFAPDGATAFALAAEIAADEGRSFIHPFDGIGVTTGTGTVGLELMSSVPDLDAVLVAVGGGGLPGGVAAAVKQINPKCAVYGVEAYGNDVMYRSFAAGSPQKQDKSTTICDSLSPPAVTPGSYALCQHFIDEIVRVEDDAICAALAVLFREMKLAVEPAGAAATAALFGPLRDRLAGKRVGVIVCGANIDADGFYEFLKRGEAVPGMQ